jgi:hypothetical protein
MPLILIAGCTAARTDGHGASAAPAIQPSPSASARCTARGQRAVAIYSTMLESQAPALRSEATAYVVASSVDGQPDASRPGPKFTSDVARCIALGLGRFAHIALVASNSDPLIPLNKSVGPIGVVQNGFVVVFGSVPAQDGRTQVTINTGGGYGFRGGEYCVSQQRSAPVVVIACGSSWIS